MAGEQTTKNVAYFLFVLLCVAMAVFVAGRAGYNRARMLDASAPKVAGEDTLEGGAKLPEQFDEPDDDALDEMAELLGEDDSED